MPYGRKLWSLCEILPDNTHVKQWCASSTPWSSDSPREIGLQVERLLVHCSVWFIRVLAKQAEPICAKYCENWQRKWHSSLTILDGKLCLCVWCVAICNVVMRFCWSYAGYGCCSYCSWFDRFTSLSAHFYFITSYRCLLPIIDQNWG